MADPTSKRRSNSAIALAALCLGACGSSRYIHAVSVNPPDASVYMNGQRIGSGDRRPYTFDFSQNQRVYVQATHPDYIPEIEWFTVEKLQQMMATNTDVKITLRPR